MQSPKKKSLDEIRRELKELLVVNLALEDITPEEIGDDEILFKKVSVSIPWMPWRSWFSSNGTTGWRSSTKNRRGRSFSR